MPQIDNQDQDRSQSEQDRAATHRRNLECIAMQAIASHTNPVAHAARLRSAIDELLDLSPPYQGETEA